MTEQERVTRTVLDYFEAWYEVDVDAVGSATKEPMLDRTAQGAVDGARDGPTIANALWCLR
jgi:hypothetical protein